MAVIAPADTLFAADRAAWREWLAAHHAERTQVWLLLHKKHVEEPSVSYDEAVEEALCWGWIDGLTKRWDERSYAVRFTPRKPGSVWSESNVARVARMIEQGRMTPAGMALVEEAKRRGTWDQAASGRLDVTPPDLEAALAGVPAARERWEDVGADAPAPVRLLGAGRQAPRDAGAAHRRRRAPRRRRPQARRARLRPASAPGPEQQALRLRGASGRRGPARAAPRRPALGGRGRTSAPGRPAPGSRR